jgi:hypothetical protein
VIRIQPTIHTEAELSRDYGLVTVEESMGPILGVVRVKSRKAGEDLDLTTTWTTRYALDLRNPA